MGFVYIKRGILFTTCLNVFTFMDVLIYSVHVSGFVLMPVYVFAHECVFVNLRMRMFVCMCLYVFVFTSEW